MDCGREGKVAAGWSSCTWSGALLACMLIFGRCVPMHAQPDDQDVSTAARIRALMEKYAVDEQSAELHRFCSRLPPEKVTELIRPYAEDSRPLVRGEAISLLSGFARDQNVDVILRAVVNRDHWSLEALQKFDWTAENAELRTRAREVLCDRVIAGDWGAARVLGRMGTAEDLPALAQGLERALRGEIEMIDSGWNLTAKWNPERGPSPLEERQWYFRAAMARLGDPGQIEFFREKINSGKRYWVRAALLAAYEAARPELAEDAAKWLFDERPWTEEWDPPNEIGMPAASVLTATFPDLLVDFPRVRPGESRDEYKARILEFWHDWVNARGWESSRPRPMESPPPRRGAERSDSGRQGDQKKAGTEEAPAPPGGTSLAPVNAEPGVQPGNGSPSGRPTWALHTLLVTGALTAALAALVAAYRRQRPRRGPPMGAPTEPTSRR